MYAPDVVAEGGGLWPEGEGSARGVDAVMASFESILQAFERSELVPVRFLGRDDALAAELMWRGVLPGAAHPVEQKLVCAYRFRDGLIIHTAWYSDLAEALEALGLADLVGEVSAAETNAAS
jgi:ketosteroid isomerase-like protein